MPRTLNHRSATAILYANGPLATLATPPAVSTTLSFEKRPLMHFSPDDIVPMPLHITLGVSSWLLPLGIGAVTFDFGAEPAKEYAIAMARALRFDVGVTPAPY